MAFDVPVLHYWNKPDHWNLPVWLLLNFLGYSGHDPYLKIIYHWDHFLDAIHIKWLRKVVLLTCRGYRRLQKIKLGDWWVLVSTICSMSCSWPFFLLFVITKYLLRWDALDVEHYIQLFLILRLLSKLLDFLLASISGLIIILDVCVFGGRLRPLRDITILRLHWFKLRAKLPHILSLKLLQSMNLRGLRSLNSRNRLLIHILLRLILHWALLHSLGFNWCGTYYR